MSGKSRALAICLGIAGLGTVAAVFCVWAQPSVPLPRWDLAISLSLALAGVGGCLVIVRRGPHPDSDGLGTSKYWWPAQRNGLLGFGLWVWIIPVFFVASAALTPSSQAWEIVDAGHTIRTVEVEKVLSSRFVQSNRSGHFSTAVQVSAPFGEGARTVENKFSSNSPVRVGDQVWVLYAPSSPALGALIDDDRGSLETEIGGPAEASVVFAAIGWAAFCWVLNLLGSVRPGPINTIKRALVAGRVRVLSVAVDHVGVRVDERPSKSSATKLLKPCVRLVMADGRHLDLYLDQVIEPVPLGRLLAGAQANLYWRPPVQKLPYGASVGYAVLVLSDQRCVQGWVETTDGSNLPQGSLVPASEQLPEGNELRAIRPFPVWDPALHSPGLWALLISLLALVIVSLGVGSFATVVLAAVAYVSPMIARSVFRSRLTSRLQSLDPDENRHDAAPQSR